MSEKYEAFCPYCGQMVVSDMVFLSEADAEQYAAMHCSCDEAQAYQKATQKKDAGMLNVDILFGPQAEQYGFGATNVDIINLLKTAVDKCVAGTISEVVIKFKNPEAGSGKVSVTGKGDIKVTRSRGKAVTLEG